MSKYTTGELAKLCGVSVRTVQYYDSRGILTPSELSEGGRRLYTDGDLSKLRIICFLRELDLPISSIGALFREKEPEQVIHLLLEEQEKSVQRELREQQERLAKLTELQKALRQVEHFSVESIGDIAHIMKNRTQLKKVHRMILMTALPMGVMEWTAIILGLVQGIWWPLVLYTLVMIPYVVWIFGWYHRRMSYICPHCHAVFKPARREEFFARHTVSTRKLTCPCCGRKSFCVETYGGEEA